MSLPEGYTKLPTYFAPKAFDIVRPDAVGISYNLDQLNRIFREAEFITNQTLPHADPTLAFVYRFATPGPFQPEPDPNLNRCRQDELYMAQNQLQAPHDSEVMPVTSKGEITTFHPKTVQVELQDTKRPLAWWLATTLMYPPAEDHRIIATPAAWWRQLQADRAAPRKKRDAFRESVATNFAGAIVLRPRVQGNEVATY